MYHSQEVLISDRRRTPNADQTLGYAIEMLHGLADLAAAAGLEALASDLVKLANVHETSPPGPSS